MTTTTIGLPDARKARVAKAAECAKTSSHSFILEIIGALETNPLLGQDL